MASSASASASNDEEPFPSWLCGPDGKGYPFWLNADPDGLDGFPSPKDPLRECTICKRMDYLFAFKCTEDYTHLLCRVCVYEDDGGWASCSHCDYDGCTLPPCFTIQGNQEYDYQWCCVSHEATARGMSPDQILWQRAERWKEENESWEEFESTVVEP